MSLADEYNSKDRGYYQNIRPEIIKLIPSGTQRLLDVGCGEGALAHYAKQELGIAYAAGIEYNEESAAIAGSRLDSVLSGNIEAMELPYEPDFFDCIICADVLEHLIDPWTVLQKLVHCLRPGGAVIVSIPNVAQWEVVKKIMRDEFAYEDHGILDRTHLRFFTRSGIVHLLESAGLQIISENNSIKLNRWQLFWRIQMLGYHKHANVIQFIMTARK
ncbi:MAG: class I SAM-dependent methyltransferase [Candidatus Kapabacteria bacterium]|nr:class I SAM-dependent methyltransferase [Candidatus Kapabacteria bacterium]